eukprot:TRINITY_DN28461_c0_g1_i1.p1 TRINITY_DN28461_c0_g1~~TRINITY_DN28461_c0_g1_i1.p1  ORF type:complete len:215 (+),score=17.93 TRINITY_DN28461_c0_g1_i1:42-686(+)
MNDETCEYIEDANYVPTESDTQDYATYLGIDTVTEADLLWIAEEGVRAKLPEGWKPCSTRKGQIYYFNTITGQSSWTHPKDVEFKELLLSERLKKKQAAAAISTYNSHHSESQGPSALSTHTSLTRDRPHSSYQSSPQSPSGVCTRLKVVSLHDNRTVCQARISSSTTFSSITSLLPASCVADSFMDSEGFAYPPQDLVQAHCVGCDTAVVYVS